MNCLGSRTKIPSDKVSPRFQHGHQGSDVSDMSLGLYTTALAPPVPTVPAWTSPQMPWGTQMGALLGFFFPDAHSQLEFSREKAGLRIFSMLFQKKVKSHLVSKQQEISDRRLQRQVQT